MSDAPRCWVNTISLDHVLLGVAGGFTQAGHGTQTRLRQLRRGDRMVFYSPRATLGPGKPLQQLTALGVVADDEPFQVEQAPDLHPWRRLVDFEEVGAVPIRPLLPLVGFIGDEQRWGMAFRRGLFEVPAGDFGVLAGAMRDAASVPVEFSTSGRTAR
jgi:hypothetical protein